MKRRYCVSPLQPFLITVVMISVFSVLINAQSITNYSFTASSGSYSALTGGTTMSLSGGTVDDGWFNEIPVGFTFIYMGAPYTTVSVSTNGWLTFGQNITNATLSNNLSTGTPRPFIAPLWDDLDLQANTNFSYLTSGTAPNRVFTAEWKNLQWNYNATGNTISFQVKLYETTGVIEFVYNDEGGTVSSGSASIGITALTGSGSGTFLSLNNTSGTPTASSTTETTTLNSKPASGQVYTFTPPAASPEDPSDLNFTGITVSGMTLNWTDNATAETNYLVYRSTDNVTFTLTANIAANSVSYNATGLSPGTTYYWKIYAANEGRISNALSGSQATNAGSLSGTKTIGASGDYATLGGAITDIQANALGGALILEFLSDYEGGETLPITLTNLTTTVSNTLTIRPADGVTGINISGSNSTAILRIQNEDYVIIDGRPGGSGSNRELTFTNTGAGPTLLLVDDASNNTIKYCNFVGSANTANNSGVVVFSTTTNTTGNDNNTVEYCDINASGSAVGIYSAGTSGKENNGNIIRNNRIHDYYINSSSTTSTYGIRIHTASTDFTITGNSLYQTASRAYSATAAIHYGISLNNTSGYHTATNNYIGGSDINCGGTAYTFSSGSARFWAFEINVGTGTATSIQGNTIQNFNLSSGFTSSGSTLFGGMVITDGTTNVGTTSGNIIGSTSGTSITINLTGAATGPIITGIATTGGTPHNLYNNTIAGITVSASSATAYGNLYAISLGSSGSVTVVDGNTIGSSSGQINNNTGSGSVTTQYVTTGIRATTGSGTTGLTFNNNIIQYLNMPAGTSNTGATLYGMQLTSTGTVYTITNNTIRNLTTGSARTTGTTSASLAGINHQGTTAPVVISGNTIHSLSQTAASAAVVVYGIYCSGATSGNHELFKNNIHSIALSTSSTSATLEGIYLAGGVYRVFNNMVRLGIDASGNSVSGNFSISGVRKASTNAHSYLFNSVYVGGSVSSGTVNTFSFRRTSQNSSDTIYNNIFVNSRSNGSGTARHYAISTVSTATGNENYNLYYANGTGGAVGSVDGGTTAQTSLLNYQTAFSGRNENSAYGDPNFVNATGTSSTVDLHIQNPTPIEGQGSTAFNYITTDFDGDTRSSLTPVDIGADAGNFTLSDIFAPTISYTALSGTSSTSNRTLASVSISDATGVPTSGTNQPRIWFRRSAPSSTSWGSTQGTLTSGTGTSGVWQFTIDYSVLGVTPVAGETYQYYVVAQDEASTPNISTNPAGGVHSDVNTQTSAPSTPNSYNILYSLSGSYNVGTGETYTTLTGAGGFFEALNNGVLTANVSVNITTNLAEDGTNALNQFLTEGGSWTLTIQPSEAAEKVISGAVTNGLIRLNGADNVTIDGRFSGSGKYLRFRNTNISNPTLTFINDATGNTVRDCYIEGATTSTTNGVVFFSTGSSSGNDNNTIQNCVIRDRSDATSVPANLVYSQGSSSTVSNSGNSISGCAIFNFTANGIYPVSTNAANDGWSITNNEIYQEAARTTELAGIRFNSEGTSNTISGNTIRDLNTSGVVNGIYLDNVARVNVFKNKIYNIPSTSGSTSTIYGIYLYGYSGNTRAYIYNNQISIIPSFTNAQTIYGIRDWADANDSIYLYYNSVLIGGTGSGASKSYAYDDNSTSTNNVVYNNAFVNERSGGTGGHFAARNSGTSSITSTNSNNNLYVGTGPTSGNNFELSSTASSFTSWKAAFTGSGKDKYSFSENAADVVHTNLFNDPTNGDLNIINTNEECWLMNGKGVAISGMADDFAASGVRSTTSGNATDIGSDEFTPSGGGATPPAAVSSGSPAPSTTTTYSTNGNTNGSIAWGAGGTVPTTVNFRYYSGVQPAGGGSAPKANFYWDISQTGGSGFSYDITLTYDEGQLNGIAESKLHPAKSTDGGTTWVAYLTEGTGAGQFQRNTTNNTITIYGLNDFSQFGLGDVDNPLPVELTSFHANVKNRDIVLNWSTATEVNAYQFEVERAEKVTGKTLAQVAWEKISSLNAAGNSNSPKEYTYTDKKLNSGIYLYRLKMLDNDGTFAYSNVIEAEVNLPKDFMLGQNYPNPFNPSTKIDYQLPQNSVVNLELYNISGERIAVLLNEEKEAGYYTYQLNTRLFGQELATGVYIYRLSASSLESETKYSNVKKLMIVK